MEILKVLLNAGNIFNILFSFQVVGQPIPIHNQVKDSIKHPPSTHERVVRVYLIEDNNPIKQVLNFDFNLNKKNTDSAHVSNCTARGDSSTNPSIDQLHEVFQLVFSGSADFIIKFDSVVMSKQTKLLIGDAIKSPLRWKNMDQNAIGGRIFIKKQPEY